MNNRERAEFVKRIRARYDRAIGMNMPHVVFRFSPLDLRIGVCWHRRSDNSFVVHMPFVTMMFVHTLTATDKERMQERVFRELERREEIERLIGERDWYHRLLKYYTPGDIYRKLMAENSLAEKEEFRKVLVALGVDIETEGDER